MMTLHGQSILRLGFIPYFSVKKAFSNCQFSLQFLHLFSSARGQALSGSIRPTDRLWQRTSARSLLPLIRPVLVQFICKYGSVSHNRSGYWSPPVPLPSGYCTQSTVWELWFHVRSHSADRNQCTCTSKWQTMLNVTGDMNKNVSFSLCNRENTDNISYLYKHINVIM